MKDLLKDKIMVNDVNKEVKLVGIKNSVTREGWRNYDSKRVWKKNWETPEGINNESSGVKATNLVSNFTRTDSVKRSFGNEKERKDSRIFDRSSSLRRTVRGRKRTFENQMPNTLERQMPEAVMKGIEKYKEKYNNFVSGGVFMNGRECTSENFVNPQVKPKIFETIKSTQDPGQHRFLISRFNEKQIYDVTRLYLAYLHDRPSYTCVDGLTATTCRAFLSSNALPVDPAKLRILFYCYHETLPEAPISRKAIDDDLSSYKCYVRSKVIAEMNRSEYNHNKFFHK